MKSVNLSKLNLERQMYGAFLKWIKFQNGCWHILSDYSKILIHSYINYDKCKPKHTHNFPGMLSLSIYTSLNLHIYTFLFKHFFFSFIAVLKKVFGREILLWRHTETTCNLLFPKVPKWSGADLICLRKRCDMLIYPNGSQRWHYRLDNCSGAFDRGLVPLAIQLNLFMDSPTLTCYHTIILHNMRFIKVES